MRRLVLLLAVLAACGSLDGENPYALWDVYEHPAGAFLFRCPLPPFDEAEGSTLAHPVLEVGAGGPGSWPRYRVEAWLTIHDTLEAAAEEEAAALAAAGFDVGATRPRRNGAGDEGLEMTAWRGEVEAVAFVLPGAQGAVVMTVSGTGDMGTPDVELLLDGFEARVPEGF